MGFRNTGNLIRGLGVMLENSPSDPETREDRLDYLNRHYLDVSTSDEWLHLQTEVPWKVWAERTEADGAASIAIGTRAVSLTGLTDTTEAFWAEKAAEGQTFVDTNDLEYTINRVTTPTATTATLYVDALFPTNGAQTTWTIRMDRPYLPADCARALRFLDRSGGMGPLVIVDRLKEENAFSSNSTATGTSYWVADDDAEFDRAPDAGWTLTSAAVGGTLPTNSLFEVCYTFVVQGRESPPSPPLQVTTTSATSTLEVANMEDTRESGALTGIYKKVYVRQLSSGSTYIYGRWQEVAQTIIEATATCSITALSGLGVDSGKTRHSGTISSSIFRRLYYQNGRKRMRPRYTPGADATLRLRYLRYPPRLVADSDVPMWPEAFHDLILYGAAIDLAAQMSQGGKIATWQAKYDALMSRMRSAQLLVPGTVTRKASMGTDTASRLRVAGDVVDGDYSG